MTELYQSVNFGSPFNIRLDRKPTFNPNTGKKSTNSTWAANLAEDINRIRVCIVSDRDVATFFLPSQPNIHCSRVINKVAPPNSLWFSQTTYSVIAHEITQRYSIMLTSLSTLVLDHQDSMVYQKTYRRAQHYSHPWIDHSKEILFQHSRLLFSAL